MFSEYQTSKQDLALIEDTAKFNEQFTNYDRKGVLGYELITLLNQVIDYNYKKSSAAGAKNDEKYSPITLEIDLMNENYVKKLTKDNVIRLFDGRAVSYKYTQSDATSNQPNTLGSILTKVSGIEQRYGSSENAAKVAKAIDSIVPTTEFQKEEDKKKAVDKFNLYVSNKMYTNYNQLKQNEKENIYKYYEYIQFKRAKFNSDSSKITYDDVTGRITKMVFEFTGEIY
mgnify:CR=1 FL=1